MNTSELQYGDVVLVGDESSTSLVIIDDDYNSCSFEFHVERPIDVVDRYTAAKIEHYNESLSDDLASTVMAEWNFLGVDWMGDSVYRLRGLNE